MSRLIPTLISPPPDLDGVHPPIEETPFLTLLRYRADTPRLRLTVTAVFHPVTRTRTGIYTWMGWPGFRIRAQVTKDMREHVSRTHYLMEDANGLLWYGAMGPAHTDVPIIRIRPTKPPAKWRSYLVDPVPEWPEPVASLVQAVKDRPILDTLDLYATELRASTPTDKLWNLKLYNGPRKLYLTWRGPRPTVRDVVHYLFATNDKRVVRLFHPRTDEARKAVL